MKYRKSFSLIVIIAVMALPLAANGVNESSFEPGAYQVPDVADEMDISTTAERSSLDIYELGASEPAENIKFYPAPDRISTRYGNLDFPGGLPTEETSRRVFDELDLQRATQLYLDMYPALSLHGMLKGNVRDYGISNTSTVGVTPGRLDSKGMYLTGNTESVYAFITMDLKKDGPVVMEIPAGVMGPLNDHNFLFVADIGPTGMDKGKGGKYLVLPPDYDGDIPDGYFVVQSETYANFSFIRANTAIVGEGEAALEFIRQNCKVYPLATGPQDGTYLDLTGVEMNSLVPEDATAFTWMHELINYEPAESFGKELLGRLASIGITRGEDFNPDARMVNIMNQAALEGVAMSRVLAFNSRDDNARVYPNRTWERSYLTENSTFYEGDYINLEARTLFHFTADGITPAMAAVMPEGTGSRYHANYKDSDDSYFDGSNTYRLNVLPDVPVSMFWSITVYDPYHRCMIQTDQPYPSISSQKEPALIENPDGSVDVFFAPEKPEGVAEQNWVRTLPDRGFFLLHRYYGPMNDFNDKKWVPNDVELVE